MENNQDITEKIEIKSTDNVIAAIDIGTNSFHMIIVKVNGNGLVTTITKCRESVRLGEGGEGDEMKILSEAAMERGLEVLRNYAKIAKTYNAKIRAIATSATREALNAHVFIESVYNETGIEIEVISGYEEGRLIHLGVSYCIPVNEDKTMVVDIGGGSTETLIGINNDIIFTNSEKLGAIRLTQRFFNDGVSQEKIEKCRKYVRGKLAPTMKKMREIGFDQIVGTAGTFETILRVALLNKQKSLHDFINGITASKNSMLDAIKIIVKAETPQEIAKIDGVEEKRADIILAGSLILEYILKNSDLNKATYSPYALREGVVYDTIQKLNIFDKFSEISELRNNTIYNLAKKYNIEMFHSEHVLKTSLMIFDTLKLKKLDQYDREILAYAALLHDIGYFVSHDQHHKHTLYLIKNSDLPGFTNDEALLIANVARYHRKSHPKKTHEDYIALSEKKREKVKLLSGILRLAEGIDRRQKQLVKDIELNFENSVLTIKLIPNDNAQPPDIEVWGANRRKLLLEEVADIKISVISDI